MERQDIVNICGIMKGDGYSRTADVLLRLYDNNAALVAERDALRAQVAACKTALEATAAYMGEPAPADSWNYPELTPTYSPWAQATNNVIALVRSALEALK